MKSPFPGMDPYLERHWEDVHTALIGYIRDELQPQLSEDLIARMEEKVYIEDENEIRRRKPDVRVVESPMSWQPEAGESSVAVLDEPIMLRPIGDGVRHRSVLISDLDGNRIITAIEILSPWNKASSRAVREYLEKRDKYVNSETNLVEIDLIRIGNWPEMVGPFEVPYELCTTYRATVSEPELAGPLHYAIPLNAILPTIRVPLRPTDPPAKLNLQGLIEKAYRMGRYDRIDYSKPCSPPLEGREKEWADALLKSVRGNPS